MKRFLKIVGIIFLFATVLAYFVFRVVFFDPFEGEFEDTERLVPSNVHFMVRRAELDVDFEKFPHPAFLTALKHNRKWQGFVATDKAKDLDAEWQFQQKLDDLDEQLEQLRSVIDPMEDVLAREVMAMGRHRDDGALGVAMVFRASNWVKLLAAGVDYDFLRGLAGDAIRDYRAEEGVSVLTMQDGTQLSLLRRLDLVVVGDDPGLVRDVGRLADGKGQEFSLTDSQYYTAAISHDSDVGRPLDFAIDVGEVARQGGWARLEAADEDPAYWKWFARTLLPGSFGLTAGRLFLGSDVELNLRASADMKKLRAEAGGLWDGAARQTSEIAAFCGRVFPSNVYACGVLHLDVSDFLQRLEGCLDAELRSGFNDFINEMRKRPAGRDLPAGGAVNLIEWASPFFGDQVAFAFEPQASYHIPGTPADQSVMPEDSWGPRVALLIPVINRSGAEDLVDVMIETVASQGARPYSWKYPDTPYLFREVEFPELTEPSISAGFVDLEDSEWLVITTTGQFLDEIVRCRINRIEGYEEGTLGADRQFKQAVAELEGTSQGFLYAESDGFRTAMKELNSWIAKEDTRPDYRTLRHDALVRMRDQKYPRYRSLPVSPEHNREFSAAASAEMDELEFTWLNETVPARREYLDKEMAWLDLFDWTVMNWRASQRDVAFRLYVRSLISFP